MKTKLKKTFLVLLSVCMVMTMMPSAVFAAEGETKGSETENLMIISVDQNQAEQTGKSYRTIQDAVDYVEEQQLSGDNSDSWLIKVNAGEYDRFLVPHGVSDLTIQGQGDSTVISTLDGSSLDVEEGDKHNSDGQGIIIWGADITLKDLKITSGTETSDIWYASAVGTQDGMWGSSDEMDTSVNLENCTFEGQEAGYAFMPERSKFSVNGCRISDYEQAIYFACDNMVTLDCNITNNTITDCTYAIHGYYGGTSQGQTQAMAISGNTISGSSERFSVIAILDQSNRGSVKLDISDNTFSYTIIGGINQRKDGDVAQGSMEAVMNANTMQNHSFVADAYYYSVSEYGTAFYAPKQKGKIATWYADPTSEAGEPTLEQIEAALEDYGTAGQVIEINAPAQEIFTIAKNAIVVEDYVDAGDLKIEKTVADNDLDNTEFSFTVKLSREDGRQLNGRYDYIDADGNMQTVTLADGQFTVSMSSGESVTVKDLLPGTKYEVLEAENSRYDSEGENISGIITANETQTVSYTNTYNWQISKSKSATELAKQSDGTYTSDVTLSLPSAEEQLVSDVVFVLDESSCTEPVKEEVREMLNSLYAQIKDTGASIKIGAVQFRGEVTEFPLKELNESTKKEIASFMNSRPETGGSNMSAGLLAGKRMLDQDESVDNNRKYLILVSDGITYIWDDETTEAQENYGVNFANADAPNVPMLASPDSWNVKYGNQYVPNNWLVHLNMVSESLSNTIQNKSSIYKRNADITGEKFVSYSEKGSYVSSVDIALYKSYQIYQDISSEYRTYAVMAGEESDIVNYPFGPSFMEYLSNGEEVTFKTIQNDIYYLLDAGSRVEDYMGYVAGENGYNFNLVNDAESFTLKVGQEEHKAERIAENRYGFIVDTEIDDGYQFILNYVPGNLQDEEHFVWEINVPVSNFAPVQLTYTVKLTNPQTSSGTYGKYDEDGSEGYSSLYTNNSAVLYPVDSNGDTGVPESFAKPTVSYTVGGSTGGGGGGGTTPPKDPEDPPELNTDDHYAYVIGYPEDYRTGEATDDESLWPVKPQNNITRAEVATIFFRMLTDESRSDYWMQTNPYSDVESDMWYNNAISTLTNAGILTGYEDGSFRPNAPITRAEFAAMAARFSDVEYSGGNSFSDVSDNYWAARYIALAEYLGWINGYPDGTFRPAQNITRAESMTLVNAVLERTPDADHMLDDMITWPDNPEGTWYYEAVQEATNSHSYEREDNESPETWLEILEVRSWADLEKEWSDANSSDNPGDVMGN